MSENTPNPASSTPTANPLAGMPQTTAPTPTPTPTPTMITPDKSHKPSKMIFAMIVVFLLLLLVGSGAYWYVTSQNNAPEPTQAAETPKPTQKPEEDLGKEIDAVDLGNVEKDLEPVDKDINTL